jgi:pimeloyl-ACP methyl ester carboxylesterase
VTEERLSIGLYVTALERLLVELRFESVHIVAHSLGTVIAQHFAVRNPTRVKSLALFGPLVAPPEAARPNIVARAKLARAGQAAMQEIADAFVKGATSKETKALQPAVLALVRESVKGQELGWFEHGSTIIVFAPRGSILCPGIELGAQLRMGQRLMQLPGATTPEGASRGCHAATSTFERITG